MPILPFWRSMISFRRSDVRVINPASILCYMKVSFRTLKYLEIHTFSIIFGKPDLMANTLLILALPSIRSLWLIPMSMVSFSPNCCSCSCASHDLVRPPTRTQHKNAPIAGCMMCAMYGMWFLNAGNSIPETSRLNCSSRVLESFDEALSVWIQIKRPSVSLTRSRTSSKCTANLVPVCWSLTYHP